jgi:hypothetical protein
MAVRNVYVAGGNGIGYTYEVDSPSDYVSISNNTYFKDLSLEVGGLILYKSSTGEILEIYTSIAGKQDLLVSNVNIKTVNGISLLGAGNVSTYSNTGNILYVATTGSDTFPDTTRISRLGSINVPFLTLEAAKAVAASGDLIYVFAGNYTPVSNIAKDGIKYYFEPNAKVTMTAAASIFDTTGFTVGFDVLGHGEFFKTTNVGYILLGGSGMSGYEAVFEARKVSSTISSCLHCPAGMNIHFKIPYLKSTGGSCLAYQGGTVKIDAVSWISTAGKVITNITGVIQDSNLTVNADFFQATTYDAIDAGHFANNNLNLNINELLGATYGLNAYGYDYGYVNLNCSYTTGIRAGANIRFSGHCGSLVQPWNGIGRYLFVGGSCQYITCEAGYIETSLGGPLSSVMSLSVSGGYVKINEVVGNLAYNSISITGGEAHIMRITGHSGYGSSLGSTREVSGGTLYLYDIDFESYVSGSNAFVPIVKLSGGNLYLRGKIRLFNTVGNPGEPSSPTTLTQTNKSNLILWTGGNLILDGCTLITQHQNDLPIVSRTANQVLRITSKGCTTNRPELGGLITAKQEKILITVVNVSYTTVNQTINTGAFSVNFSTPTAGKTVIQVATDLCSAINANAIPVTATDNGDGSYYLEADVAGAPFTYTLWNQPYNGQSSLSGNIIRDNSYAMLNPMGGQIIESQYAQ